MVVTSFVSAGSATSECRVQSAECGISVAAAAPRLRPRLSFDDSCFVGSTPPVADAMEGWWFFVAGWWSVFESRVGDLIIIFSNSINSAGRPLNRGDLEGQEAVSNEV